VKRTIGTWFALALLLAAAGSACAATGEEPPTVIVVQGAQGEAEFGEVFSQSADKWVEAAKRGGAEVVEIGRSAAAGGAGEDKQRLQQAIEQQVKKTTPQLWVVLIGHGTYDGKEAKFNLRGEDFSDTELAAWLRPCVRPLAVVDGSSASATFLSRLSGKGRVVITATRTGHEVNYARFGAYLAEAIADPAADLDKDGQTSLLEAYLAAAHRVEEFYKNEGRLATEHPLLDDNGDGLGTPPDFFEGIRATRAARNGAPLDGALSRKWVLVPSAAEQAMPAEAKAQRDELESQIESLRAKKSTMSEGDYYGELDPLLLKLARVYEQSEKKP
jgi:hypothetical protein